MQVAEDGTAKLYLGTELVEHAAGVNAAEVMRVLVDYAATIDADVRVTTQMPDGTWTRHWLDPDGTIRRIPPKAQLVHPARARQAVPPAPVRPRQTALGARIEPRTRAIVLVLLIAALLIAAITWDPFQ